MIADRPAEVEDRTFPGTGKATSSSALRTVPRSAPWSNGLRGTLLHPLADHGATAVRNAITSTIPTLCAELRRSLTWDQGIELIGMSSWPGVLLGSGACGVCRGVGCVPCLTARFLGSGWAWMVALLPRSTLVLVVRAATFGRAAIVMRRAP